MSSLKLTLHDTMLCFILSNSNGTEHCRTQHNQVSTSIGDPVTTRTSRSHNARSTFSSKLGSTTLGASLVVVIVVIVSRLSSIAGLFSRHLEYDERPPESSLVRPALAKGFPGRFTGEVGFVVGGVYDDGRAYELLDDVPLISESVWSREDDA